MFWQIFLESLGMIILILLIGAGMQWMFHHKNHRDPGDS